MLSAMMASKRAIYPGSFDPITNGHVDIIERSLRVFDEITIVVAINKRKSPRSLFSADERKELIAQVFQKNDRVKVDVCGGLLMEYARENQIMALVRGLRATSDFENEFLMATMNRELNDQVETFFIMTGKDLFYVSSSAIKEVASLGGDVSKYVPELVSRAMRKKYEGR